MKAAGDCKFFDMGALVVVLALALASAGCQTGVSAECAKKQQCGQLAGKTQDQCSADGSNCYDKLHASALGLCNAIANAEDAWLHCVAGLTCADRMNLLTVNAACKRQFDVLTQAVADSKLQCPCYF